MKRLVTIGILCAACALAEGPQFEVASVKVAEKGTAVSEQTATTFMRKTSLFMLFRYAYNLQDYQIEVPKWFESELYTVNAKTSEPTDQAGMRLRLGALLADRFHLKFHTEIRETTVMALVPAKGGPKVREARHDEETDPLLREQIGHAAFFRNITAEQFAQRLGTQCGTLNFLPIVDKTGLVGAHDFVIDTHANPTGLPRSVFDQVCEEIGQLGLAFKKDKAAITYYVVDSADRLPSEN